MYVKQLGLIVQQLLQQHPMVILPGVGGFVVERVSAQLDVQRGRIMPPSFTVLFNAQLSHNDGLLAQSIAAHWGFSLTEADNWLTDAIAELKFCFSNNETVQWLGIGQLHQNWEGRIQFVPEDAGMLMPEVFGLRPIQLSEIRHKVDLTERTLEVVRSVPVKRIVSYAAAAMLAGVMIWLPFQEGAVSTGKQLAAEMGVMSWGAKQHYTPRTFSPTWQLESVSESDNATLESSASVEISEEAPVLEQAPAVVYPTRFYVVAGSYSTKTQAEASFTSLRNRGFEAEYAGVDANGTHLVAYGTYTTIDDASSMLASVSLSNKEARIVPAN